MLRERSLKVAIPKKRKLTAITNIELEEASEHKDEENRTVKQCPQRHQGGHCKLKEQPDRARGRKQPEDLCVKHDQRSE